MKALARFDNSSYKSPSEFYRDAPLKKTMHEYQDDADRIRQCRKIVRLVGNIDDSDDTPANVGDNNTNETLKDIHGDIKELTTAVNNNTRNQERAVFNGVFRAQARFEEPADEVAIEKVHRLRCDNVEWDYIAREIYREEKNKEISEEELPKYVNALQQKYKRAYPDPTSKKST